MAPKNTIFRNNLRHRGEINTNNNHDDDDSCSSASCRPSIKLVVAFLIFSFVAACYVTLVFVIQPFAASSIDLAVTTSGRQSILRAAQQLEDPLNRTSRAIHGFANITRLPDIRYPRRNNLSTSLMVGALLQGGLALGRINDGQTALVCRPNDGTYSSIKLIYAIASRQVAAVQIHQAFASGFYNGSNVNARDKPKNMFYEEYNTTSLEPLSIPLFAPLAAAISTSGVNGVVWNQSKYLLPMPSYVNVGLGSGGLGSDGVSLASL